MIIASFYTSSAMVLLWQKPRRKLSDGNVAMMAAQWHHCSDGNLPIRCCLEPRWQSCSQLTILVANPCLILQAVMRSEHTISSVHFLRKPLNIEDQHSSGPMPWQSKGVQPDTELLAIGTGSGALHIFDWHGRLLLDLPQAIPGMALLVSLSYQCCANHL